MDSDSEIEVVQEVKVTKDAASYNLDVTWNPLFFFLLSNKKFLGKHPDIKSKKDREKLVAKYINCWNVLKYNFSTLQERIAENTLKIQKKEVSGDAMAQEFHAKLREQKELGAVAEIVSLSTLIDRTTEFYTTRRRARAPAPIPHSPEYRRTDPQPGPSQPPLPPQSSAHYDVYSAASPERTSGFASRPGGYGGEVKHRPPPPPPPTIQTLPGGPEEKEFTKFVTEQLARCKEVEDPYPCSKDILLTLREAGLWCLEMLTFYCVNRNNYADNVTQFECVLRHYLTKNGMNRLILTHRMTQDNVVRLLTEFCQHFIIHNRYFLGEIAADQGAVLRYDYALKYELTKSAAAGTVGHRAVDPRSRSRDLSPMPSTSNNRNPSVYYSGSREHGCETLYGRDVGPVGYHPTKRGPQTPPSIAGPPPPLPPQPHHDKGIVGSSYRHDSYLPVDMDISPPDCERGRVSPGRGRGSSWDTAKAPSDGWDGGRESSRDRSRPASHYSGREGSSHYSGREGSSHHSGREGSSHHSGREGSSHHSGREGSSHHSGREGSSHHSGREGSSHHSGREGFLSSYTDTNLARQHHHAIAPQQQRHAAPFSRVDPRSLRMDIVDHDLGSLPGHPLFELRPSNCQGRNALMRVAVELEVVSGDVTMGEKEILRLGARLDDNQEFFCPVALNKMHNRVLPQTMEMFGFVDLPYRYIDPITKKSMPIVDQKTAMRDLVQFLCLGVQRNAKDGIILCTLYQESFLSLIECVIDNDLGEEFLDVVKEVCILEPVIQTKCFTDTVKMRIEPSTVAGLFRPSTSFPLSPLQLSWLTLQVFVRLEPLHQHTFKFLARDLDNIKTYLSKRDDLKCIFPVLADPNLSHPRFSSGFNPFPNPDQLAKPNLYAATLFIDLLVMTNHKLSHLTMMVNDPAGKDVTNRLYRKVFDCLHPPSAEMKRMQHMFNQLTGSVVNYLERQHRNSSGSRHPSGGNVTPRSGGGYDSEGSLPEERNLTSPVQDLAMRELKDHLCQMASTRNPRLFTRATLENVTNRFCRNLEKGGYPAPKLRNYTKNSAIDEDRKKNELVQVVLSSYNGVERATDWKGLSVWDLVGQTISHFRGGSVNQRSRRDNFDSDNDSVRERRESTSGLSRNANVPSSKESMESASSSSRAGFINSTATGRRDPSVGNRSEIQLPELSDKEMVKLEDHFRSALLGQKHAWPQVDSLARILARALEEADINYARLQTLLKQPEIGKQRVAHSLKRKHATNVGSLPESWQGVGLEWIVDQCANHCSSNGPVAGSSGRGRGLGRGGGDIGRGGGRGGGRGFGRGGGRGGGFGNKRIGREEGEGEGAKRLKTEVVSLRPNEQSTWDKLLACLDVEMRALVIYTDRVKGDDTMFAEMDSRRILLGLSGALEQKEMGFKSVKTRITAMKSDDPAVRCAEGERIADDLFGQAEKQQQRSKKQYQGSSDFVMYRKLFLRFCEYLATPAKLEEDIAKNQTEVMQEPEPPSWVATVENIETIIALLKQRYKKLSKGSVNVISQKLHEHIFYNQSLKKISANSCVQTQYSAKVANDFVLHLNRHWTMDKLVQEITSMRTSFQKKDFQKHLMEKLVSNKWPETLKTKYGLLLNLLSEFVDHQTNQCLISQEVLNVKMEIDNSNALGDLQEYLFQCYLEEAKQMTIEGQLEGFRLDLVDIPKLSQAVHSTVNYLLEAGFTLYEAIEKFIEGKLSESVKSKLKLFSISHPEANFNILLTRLIYDFIDIKMKQFRTASLPMSRMLRTRLKLRVVNLINNGQFLRPNCEDRVEIKMSIPRTEFESLTPLATEVKAEEIVDVKEEIGANQMLGNITLSRVITVPARSEKSFFCFLTGLPALRPNSVVQLVRAAPNPSTDVEVVLGEVSLEMDQTVTVKVRNLGDANEVILPKGCVIAKARVKDPQNIKSASPGYCLQFIRQYFSSHGLDNIRLDGEYICFGEDIDMRLPQNRRTNFKIDGTVYSQGVQNYYTVEAVVYFLHQVPSKTTPYSDYLRLCLEYDHQVVRQKDVAPLFQYLHSEIETCEQIDREFTTEQDAYLEKMLTITEGFDCDLSLTGITDLLKREEVSVQTEWTDELDTEKIDLETVPTSNRGLVLQLRDHLTGEWRQSGDQATQSIGLLVTALTRINNRITKVRMDYFGLPHKRDLYKEVIGGRVRRVVEQEMGYGGEREAEENMRYTFETFRYSKKPEFVSGILILNKFLNLLKGKLIKDDAETMMERLYEGTIEKTASEKYEWTTERDEAFKRMVLLVSKLKPLKPPTKQGLMALYTGVSQNCLCSLLVLERGDGVKDEHSECMERKIPVALNSRSLSPKESKLSKPEKEALAVTWALGINKHLIKDGKEEDKLDSAGGSLCRVVIRVSSTVVFATLADREDPVTRVWWEDRIGREYSHCTVEQVKKRDNLALVLGACGSDEVTEKLVNTPGMVEELFSELLNCIKRTAKNRSKWLKYHVRKEWKRLKNDGLGEEEGEAFDPARQLAALSTQTASFSGQVAPAGVLPRPTASRPTDNLSATTKGLSTGSLSADSIVEELSEPGVSSRENGLDNLPPCSVPEYQPIFQMFYCYLMGQSFSETKAEEVANKVFTRLFINSVTYHHIKEEIVRMKENRAEAGGKEDILCVQEAQEMLTTYLSGRVHLASFQCSEDLVRIMIDHFFSILKIRPLIRVNLSRTNAIEEGETGTLEPIDMDCSHSIQASSRRTSYNGGADSMLWYEELMNEEAATGEVREAAVVLDRGPADECEVVNWTAGPHQGERGGEESHSGRKGMASCPDRGVGSYEELEEYCDKLILKLRRKGVTGRMMVQCWEIVGSYEILISAASTVTEAGGRVALITHLNQLLTASVEATKVMPKSVDLEILSVWTAVYLLNTCPTTFCLLPLANQKQQLLQMQQQDNQITSTSNEDSTTLTSSQSVSTSWQPLEAFIRDVLVFVYEFSQKQAAQTAGDCIQAFILLGLTAGEMEILGLAAAGIADCLKQLTSRLSILLRNLSCLLPPSVDSETLLRLTIMFYRAHLQVSDLLREIRAQRCDNFHGVVGNDGQEETANNFNTLSSLIEHSATTIHRQIEREGAVVGQVALNERIPVPADEFITAQGTAKFFGNKFCSPPPRKTPLRLVANNPTMNTAYPNLELAVQLFRWDDSFAQDNSIELGFTNNGTSVCRVGGSAVIAGTVTNCVAVLELSVTEPADIKNACDKCGRRLAESGVNLQLFTRLCHDVVNGTSGFSSPMISRIALQHAVSCTLADRQSVDSTPDLFMFKSFILEAVHYASKLKPEDNCEKIVVKKEQEEEEEETEGGDCEDGELQSDSEEHGGSDRNSETDGEISFPGTTIPRSDLLQPPVTQLAHINLWSVLRRQGGCLEVGEDGMGKILAGKYLLDGGFEVEIDTGEGNDSLIRYRLSVLVLFAHYMSSSQAVYVKKVSYRHPGIDCVHADHRHAIKTIIDDETSEKMIEVEVMSREERLKRLYQRFETLTKPQVLPDSIPRTKSEEFTSLFERYFRLIYPKGLACQRNWVEVCRVTCEELTQIWVGSGITFPYLMHKVAKASQEKSENGRVSKIKRLFRRLLDKFSLHPHTLPQNLNILTFLKTSLEFLEDIVAQQKQWLDNIEVVLSDEDLDPIDDMTRDSPVAEAERTTGGERTASVDEDDEGDEDLVGKLQGLAESLNSKDENDVSGAVVPPIELDSSSLLESIQALRTKSASTLDTGGAGNGTASVRRKRSGSPVDVMAITSREKNLKIDEGLENERNINPVLEASTVLPIMLVSKNLQNENSAMDLDPDSPEYVISSDDEDEDDLVEKDSGENDMDKMRTLEKDNNEKLDDEEEREVRESVNEPIEYGNKVDEKKYDDHYHRSEEDNAKTEGSKDMDETSKKLMYLEDLDEESRDVPEEPENETEAGQCPEEDIDTSEGDNLKDDQDQTNAEIDDGKIVETKEEGENGGKD